MPQLPGEVFEYTEEDAALDTQRDREDRKWKPEFAPDPNAPNPFDKFVAEPDEAAQKLEQGEIPFAQRFKQHFINASRGGTGGLIEGVRMQLERDPVQLERFRNEAVALDKQFENMPAAESTLDYIGAVGGALSGGAADPASAIPVLRVGTVGWQAAKPLLAPIINQTVSGAALNALVNLADQGLEVANDMRGQVDLWDTFIQSAVGAVAGTGFGGLQGWMNVKAADAAKNLFEREALATAMANAPEPGKAPRAPARKAEEGPKTIQELAGTERIAELQDQLFGGRGTAELTPEERNQLEDTILAEQPGEITQGPIETEGSQGPLNAASETEIGLPKPKSVTEVAPLGRDIREFDPDELKVDAKRFQFKEGGDEAGVTERLKGVKKWDRTKAGITLVWESKNGEFFIADGHQRHGLAKKLKGEGQAPKITGLVLREADGVSADDARVIAAAKNIAEGTGNAIDAAKILRSRPDMGVDLPPTSALVRDATGLAKLSDDAFGMVVNRKVSAGYAAIVGRLAPDQGTHGELLSLLAKQEPANAVEAESIIRDAMEAPAVQQTMTDMFGTSEVTQILFKERAQIISAAANAIKKDRAAFGTLVRESERIKAAGNVLAGEANVERAQFDAELLAVLQAEARRKGPIGDALATAAKRLKDGEPRQAVVRDFIESVRQQAQSLGKGRRGAGASGQPEQVAALIGGRRTDSPAFKKWFGDSKVVDESGQPLIVYHGTNDDIQGFDPEKLGSQTGAQSAREGFFFTDDPAVGSSYADRVNPYQEARMGERGRLAQTMTRIPGYERMNEALLGLFGKSMYPRGQNVVPVYLSLKNPKVLDMKDQDYSEAITPFIRQAKKEGHDGVIIKDIVDPGTSPEGEAAWQPSTHYVVFEPEQIKSIFNRGTWDAQEPNIAFSARGRQQRENVSQETIDFSGGKSKTLQQRMADAPLRGKVAQQPTEFGLFGDEKDQLDLVDLAKIAPRIIDDIQNIDMTPGGHTVRLGNSSITYNVMGDRVEILAVRTPPDARRQGAARAAMTAFLDRMDDEGFDVTTVAKPLEQTVDQGGVTKLYKAFGFEETGRGVGESPELLRTARQNAVGDLKKMVAANMPIDAIGNHPLITDSVRRMEEIPPTNQKPDYGTDDYWKNREFIFGDEKVTGLEEATKRLVDQAESYSTKGPVKRDAHVTIIIGPAAAGKSTIAERIAAARFAAIADVDDAKYILPEYQKGLGANAVHEESSDIGAEVLGRLVDKSANIVLPKVGANAIGIERLITQFKELGYRVDLIGLRVSYENAFRRMINRFLSTGRLISPEYVKFVGEKPTATYRALREKGIADGYAEIDGNGAKGASLGIIEDEGDALRGIPGLGRDRGSGPDQGIGQAPPEEIQAIAARSRVQPQGLPPTNRPQAGTASQPGAEGAEQLEAIGQDLKSLVGFPVRQGRLHRSQAGKVVGQFDRTQGVMRLREMADFETQVHETAHALETEFGQGFNAIKGMHRAELEPMAYPGAPAKQQLSEGFAEWLRFYITTPLYAQRTAPNFTAAFEQYMSQRKPELLKGLADVSSRFVDWTKTPSRAAVSADIMSQRRGSALTEAVSEMRREGWRPSLGRLFDKIYTGAIDKLHPINVAVDRMMQAYEKRTGQAMNLKAADNPYVRARIMADAYSAGHVDLMHGIVPHRGTMSEGPGLSDALSVAFGDQWRSWDDTLLQDFGAYLVSRRAIQEYRRWNNGEIPNPPGKFTEGDYRVAREEFEAAHPEWVQAADMVYEWGRNLLKKKFEAGFIGSDLYTELLKRADYVPMLREMSNLGDEILGLQNAGPGTTLKQSIVKSFQGSKRAVLNPIETMAQDAYRTNALIQRNEVFKALEDMAALAGPGGGSIVERIPSTQLRGTKVDVNEAIRGAAKDSGLSDQEVDTLTALVDDLMGKNASATIFRAGEISEKGEPIIYAWRNGKRQALRLADGEFGRDMYQALTGMSREARNIFIETMALPSTVLRYGITTDPAFLLANYIRDQMSAWILTGNGFIPFISGARGIGDELVQTEITKIYNTAMGIMGGGQVAALDKARAMRDVRKLNKRGYAVKRFGSWRGFAELTEISETGTRLAVFRNAFNRARKEGLTDFEAMIEASFTSRDYIDFGRHGSHMYAARRLVPFLNASLQGMDKTLRTLGGLRHALRPYVLFRAGKPLSAAEKKELAHSAMAFAKMQAIGMFGLGLSYIYRDDPEYEDISDYLRATHWMVKDYGWMSDKIPGTQRTANGKWIAIPKPFDLAIFSNLYERSFESIYGKDEIAMQKFMSGLWQISAPPYEVPLVQTYFEIKANEKFDTGRPIVPERLQGLDPHLQFNAYTSWIGKKIGEMTGTSPMMIDHAIAGIGGSWGRNIADTSREIEQGNGILSSTVNSVSRRFIRDATRGSTSTRAFWDQVSTDGGRLVRTGNSYADLVKNGAPGDADKYLEGKTDNEVTYAILNAYAEADAKRLHPMRRAQDAILAVSGMRRQIANDDLTLIESDKEAPEKITLTPSARQMAQDILGRIEMAEARNALITIEQPGWKQRDYTDTESLKHDLELALPAVYEELLMRYEKSKVYDDQSVREIWPEVKERALTDRQEATFDDLVAGAQ